MGNLLIIAVVALIAYNACKLFGEMLGVVIISTCRAVSWFFAQQPVVVIPGILVCGVAIFLLFYWIGS